VGDSQEEFRPMITKKRLIGATSLAGFACLVLGVLAMLPPHRGVTKTNFDRIQTGMTRAEVEEIFGGPGSEVVCMVGSNTGATIIDGPRKMYWFIGDDWSSANVWFVDDRVDEKDWHEANETVPMKIRRWLHLR
jgi:hypothetical protein